MTRTIKAKRYKEVGKEAQESATIHLATASWYLAIAAAEELAEVLGFTYRRDTSIPGGYWFSDDGMTIIEVW